MSRAGRPRKPMALKIASGTHRPDRDAPQIEIEPGIPDKPEHLGEYASAEWDRLVAEIRPMGILGKADRTLLTQICEANQEYYSAKDILAREGMVCVSQSGASYQHPMVGVMHNAADRITKLAQQFGLSPAARTNLKPPETKKADTGKAKFFEKHG